MSNLLENRRAVLFEIKEAVAGFAHQCRMPRYRIRFFDHSGRVFGSEEMDCAQDQLAIEKARELHTHGIGAGYEIWEGERHVHTEKLR